MYSNLLDISEMQIKLQCDATMHPLEYDEN